MVEVISLIYLAGAVLSLINVHRHAKAQLVPTYWGGASVAGQACMACFCITLATLFGVRPCQGTWITWVFGAVGLFALCLGLRLESRARSGFP